MNNIPNIKELPSLNQTMSSNQTNQTITNKVTRTPTIMLDKMHWDNLEDDAKHLNSNSKQIRISEDDVKILAIIAKSEGRSLSSLIRLAIKQYINLKNQENNLC